MSRCHNSKLKFIPRNIKIPKKKIAKIWQNVSICFRILASKVKFVEILIENKKGAFFTQIKTFKLRTILKIEVCKQDY